MATQRTRFSAAAAAGGAKRPAQGAAEEATPQKKVPRASELVIETGPKPQRAAERLPENAPIVVAIYKVTARAGDVWNQFEGIQQCDLFQVQQNKSKQKKLRTNKNGSRCSLSTRLGLVHCSASSMALMTS